MKPLTTTIILSFIVLASSCESIVQYQAVDTAKVKATSTQLVNKSGTIEYNYDEYAIDGCQYIVIDRPYRYEFEVIHKGNCNNPIHRR